MIKNIIITSCLAILATGICRAQTNDSQITTNWGESVQGVQLSIGVTNRIINVGSSTLVFATIYNSSTNTIFMFETREIIDFVVTMKSRSGVEYKITPDTSKMRIFRSGKISINAGKSRTWSIPVSIPKDIPLGEYVLKATTRRVGFELTSNLLKVQIK